VGSQKRGQIAQQLLQNANAELWKAGILASGSDNTGKGAGLLERVILSTEK
jgi:hypothetical protein